MLSFGLRLRLYDSSKQFNTLQEFATVPKGRFMTYVEGDMAFVRLGL